MILSNKILQRAINKYGKEKGIKIISVMEMILILFFISLTILIFLLSPDAGIIFSMVCIAFLVSTMLYKLLSFGNDNIIKEMELESSINKQNKFVSGRVDYIQRESTD